MNATVFEAVTPNVADAALPCRLEQTTSRLRPAIVMALLIAVAVLALVPFILLASHVAAAPSGLDLIAERPAAALKVLAAALMAGTLLGWPLARVLSRIGRSRSVRIEAGRITVTDRTLAGETTWSEPISGFTGLAHHIRTTLSVTRHELILVHPDPHHHVMLMIADRISKGDVEAVASRLGVAEASPRLLYGLSAAIVKPAPSGRQPVPAAEALQQLRAA